MLSFIEILRALAVGLITNSHFKGVYPNDILSFGGGLGLAVFYMISGYVLANINEKTHFIKWYLKKVIRLYIPLWIFRVVEICVGYRHIKSPLDFIYVLIHPIYWFVISMLILYIIYYIYIKFVYLKFGNKSLYFFSGVLVLAYTILYITEAPIGTYSMDNWVAHSFGIETPYVITQMVWMLCMLLGIWLRNNGIVKEKSQRWLCLIGAFLMVMLFMMIKLMIGKDVFLASRYFLGVSYVGFAYFMFLYFMSNEGLCKMIFETLPGKVLKIVSKCSLEIYYVQFIWINMLKNVIFPINWILLIVAIVGSGYLLHEISTYICKRMEKRLI